MKTPAGRGNPVLPAAAALVGKVAERAARSFIMVDSLNHF
jgi:hypothetical protein